MSNPTITTWRKSTYSAPQNACIEIATAGNDVLLRDSKHPAGGYLSFTRSALAAFVAAAKAGELDGLVG